MLSTFKAILLITFCCFSSLLFSQSKEFDNVVNITLKNTITIKNNSSIVGYAFFYQLDKSKKGSMYRLEIMDENLKSIGSNEFEGSKELLLDDAVYESEHILLAFEDVHNRTHVEKFSKIFDLKGKETGVVPYDPDKVRKGIFSVAAASSLAATYNGFDNVEGKGFACVFQSPAKTGGADVQMIDKTGKLSWEQNLTADKGLRMDVYLATTTPNALIFFAAIRGGILAHDTKNFLIGLSTQDGKELFRKTMEIDQFAWEPMLFKTDNNNNLKMICSLSHEEDKFYTAKPIGFNISTLNDKTGEISLDKNFLFAKDLNRVLNMENESKSDQGFIKMHDLCLMPDGSKILVGEFFRRKISASGIALKILTEGNAAASHISINELFLLRIDAKNNATGLDKIDKGNRKAPVIADGMPLGAAMRLLSIGDYFGYRYTDDNIDPHKKTVITYGDFDGDGYKTAAVNFSERKGYKIKKFNLPIDKKDQVTYLRGKPGHMLVMHYNAKDKKVSLNLERVD